MAKQSKYKFYNSVLPIFFYTTAKKSAHPSRTLTGHILHQYFSLKQSRENTTVQAPSIVKVQTPNQTPAGFLDHPFFSLSII